ncbi:FKBP-type peptidyl-prolyl cis-trans isomerase [Desulfogranum japonicum]|uniref:FKBP-type peptidyl-prolyl cis-trans isomerase n=1 Tax=Desulfogranum japonicum TaxID=231447 RepID=UPI0003FD505B|nr:FKBP-type peptidyl-prolyl cis-trans isomerase [Desulfogranum japonicum]
MKLFTSAVVVLLLVVHTAAAQDARTKPESDQDKLSYAMGLDLGAYLKNIGEELNLDRLSEGMADAYNGTEPLLTAEEARAVQETFAKRQKEQQIKESIAKLQKNQEAEKKFLAENKTKEGVVETESGLQYKVIKSGEGAKPTVEDMVEVNYRGTLLDGTEFDSSYKRNQSAKFQVKQVIPGWQEALQLMPVGSEYEIYIPAKLAYGDRGVPPTIEPGSTLTFKVELLDIPQAETKSKE